jgi:hypothetical protein
MKAGKTWPLVLVVVAVIIVLWVSWPAGVWAQEVGPPPAEEVVTVDPLGTVQDAQPDYKALYFDALERLQEYEAAFEEALSLAKSYRSGWEAQRDIAEARGLQADQAIKLSETLLTFMRDMKDTIDKQHEIIMTLTAPKQTSLQLIGGAIVSPRHLDDPGVLLAIGVSF